MKSYFVDFEGWIKVPAEDAEGAKKLFCELLRKWRLEKSVMNYDVNIDTVEEEEE